ncbi:MAG: 6-phosphogluconolactonase [archaeon]
MEIIKGKREELDSKAAKLISEAIWKASEEKTNVVLGLTGGRNSYGVLQELREADVDWTKVEIFMIDETYVPLDKPESHFQAVNGQLISYLVEEAGKLPLGNVHPFNYRKSLQGYNDEFMAAGGRFDIVLLTLEEDCRTASLLDEYDVDGGEAFVEVEGVSKGAKEGMTATRALLGDAGTVLALAYGESSRRILDEFYDDRVSVGMSPVKMFKGKGEFYLLTDLS